MCGICGAISTDRRQIEPAVRRMMNAMIHRGPDDEGYAEVPLAEQEIYAGFGFRRLSILDLSSAGHQPMFNPTTGDCLIFNGEIYNHQLLRSKLKAAGVEPRSSGDSEVLLHALSLWGECALDELDGMFAFAFYEAKTRRILLARDHVGIKPLYVAKLPNRIVFASEVRAVLSSAMVPFDLDPAGIAGFLAYGSPQDPDTVHAHIKSMPAGSFEWLDAWSLRISPRSPVKYWTFPSISPAINSASDATAVTKDLLEKTITEQSVADVQVASFLSGGIDSAILSAIANRHCRGLRTFCVGYESGVADDETAAAAQTAVAIGSRHYQTILDKEWMLLQWHQWLLAADRPSIDGLNTYVVSGAVKDNGATVALSGLGADELFGGYPQFWMVPRMHRWLAPFTWIPRPMRRGLAAVAFAQMRQSRRERATDMVVNCDSPVDLLLRMRRVFMASDLAELGLPAERVGLLENYLQPEIYDSVTCDAGDTFHAISRAESSLYMNNTILRDSDINGMAHFLEIRVPFLGRKFVETIAAMPGRLLSPAGAPPKHVLRRAAAHVLPPDVFNRPKRGFSLPIGEWMFGELRDQCEAAVDSASACPLFEDGSVRRIWNRLVENRHQMFWSRALALVVLGDYLRKINTLSRMRAA